MNVTTSLREGNRISFSPTCPDLLRVPPASKSMNTGSYFPEG